MGKDYAINPSIVVARLQITVRPCQTTMYGAEILIKPVGSRYSVYFSAPCCGSWQVTDRMHEVTRSQHVELEMLDLNGTSLLPSPSPFHLPPLLASLSLSFDHSERPLRNGIDELTDDMFPHVKAHTCLMALRTPQRSSTPS